MRVRSALFLLQAICQALLFFGCSPAGPRRTEEPAKPVDVKETATYFTGVKKIESIDELSRLITWHQGKLNDLKRWRGDSSVAQPKPKPATLYRGGSATRAANESTPRRSRLAKAPPVKTPAPASKPSPEPAVPHKPPAARLREQNLPTTGAKDTEHKSAEKKKSERDNRCDKARQHTAAICQAASKICRLADALGETSAANRCFWARGQCLKARRRGKNICGSTGS